MYNGEHYTDHTAEDAIRNIEREEAAKKNKSKAKKKKKTKALNK